MVGTPNSLLFVTYGTTAARLKRYLVSACILSFCSCRSPIPPGKMFGIVRTGLIRSLNDSLGFFGRYAFPFAGAGDSAVHRRVDKAVNHILSITQGIIGTPAHKNTGAFPGQLLNGLLLEHIQLLLKRLDFSGCAHYDGIEKTGRPLFLVFLDKLLRKAAFQGGFLQNFAVITGDA